MGKSIGRAGETFVREADHFVGNIDAVDLLEMAAERAHQAAGTAADFERGVAAGEAGQLRQQLLHGAGGGGEELFVGLLAAAEGHVIIGVLGGAPIPIGAHRIEQVRSIHVPVAILTSMALVFRHVTVAPLVEFDAAAPDGAVIGVVGENGAGKERAGAPGGRSGATRSRARWRCHGGARLLGPDDALNLAPAPVLAIDHTFARHDLLVRERAAVAIDRLRQAGSTILVVSHEEELLRRLADEVWWLHEGKLAARGDPEEILCAYRQHIAARVRAWGGTMSTPINPRFFRGDGRAEIVGVELAGEDGRPTMAWRSGRTGGGAR